MTGRSLSDAVREPSEVADTSPVVLVGTISEKRIVHQGPAYTCKR